MGFGNIHAFSKLPPVSVLYIYKVWQPKYDDIKSLGVNFIEDNDNVVNNIKSSVSGQPMLVIFDDLMVYWEPDNGHRTWAKPEGHSTLQVL